MTIHTYRARTLNDALRLVREELGPDASVLSTREVKTGWSRWLSGTQIEVTASAEVRVPSRLRPPESMQCHVPAAELTDFRRQFQRDLMDRAAGESSLVEQLTTVGQASRLSESSLAHASGYHHRRRDACGTVAALVGPTGVGKTTTIAKLAARFQIHDRCRVGLVTTDIYRIAAIQQLEAYAQIIDAPLEVAAGAAELRAALGRLDACDLVLIDTAGISPHDRQRLAELQDLLAQSACDEIHLVLSATASPASLDAAARAFAAARASALIVTKLDEAASVDWLPEFTIHHHLPLRYTTSGQNVPHDLEPAGSTQLLTAVS